MSNGEIMGTGFVIAMLSFLVLVSPPLSSLILNVVGIAADKLLFLSIMGILGGIAFFVVGIRDNGSPAICR
jgi:hypothetical protein